MKYALSPKTHLEQSIFNLYNSLNIWNPHEIDLELISESLSYWNNQNFWPQSNYDSSSTLGLDVTCWCFIRWKRSEGKIAHEICHCLNHVGNQLILPVSFIQENQSQAGSAHLLMPLWMLSSFDLFMEYNQLVQFLSKVFRVSLSLLVNAYNWLNVEWRNYL